jgi:hypothetical protein
MENLVFSFIFLVFALLALFAAYQAFKHHRNYWFAFSKTAVKSEKIPKWFAWLVGTLAFIFGLFAFYLSIKLFLSII